MCWSRSKVVVYKDFFKAQTLSMVNVSTKNQEEIDDDATETIYNSSIQFSNRQCVPA